MARHGVKWEKHRNNWSELLVEQCDTACSLSTCATTRSALEEKFVCKPGHRNDGMPYQLPRSRPRLVQYKLGTLSRRRLAEISGLRTSATSQVVFMLLPALVLTRKRRCPLCLMCDPFAPLKPTPLCDLEVASRGCSVHTDLGSTLSTAPESTNASNSIPPRILSFRSVTELMVAMGSSPQSRPNRSLSASLDGSVPTSSTSWQSSADGQSLAGWPFPPHLQQMRRFFCPAPGFVSSHPGFLSHGVDWRDADGDELAVRRLKGFRSLSDSCLCFWLDRSCKRRC